MKPKDSVTTTWAGCERHCWSLSHDAKALGFAAEVILPIKLGGDAAVRITAPVKASVRRRGHEVELVVG